MKLIPNHTAFADWHVEFVSVKVGNQKEVFKIGKTWEPSKDTFYKEKIKKNLKMSKTIRKY